MQERSRADPLFRSGNFVTAPAAASAV